MGRFSRKKLAVIFLFLMLVLWSVSGLFLRLVPLPASLFETPQSIKILVDRHGQPLRKIPQNKSVDPVFQSNTQEKRSWNLFEKADFQDIPESLIQSTLVAEDQRFWRHGGMDRRSTFRALIQLVKYRKIVSGGSTITQQLIKLAKPRPRTFSAKIVEALQACRLEQIWSKQRILTEYLNRVDYGNRCIGCAEASTFYFGKPLKDLSWAESALLAGLPQAPSRLNPLLHYARARKRQEWILNRLLENGILTPSQWSKVWHQPVQLKPRNRPFEAPHFVDLAIRFDPYPRHTSGTTRTTIDLGLNREVENIVRSFQAPLKDRNVHNAAAVILKNRTGEVLALVGSENFFNPQSGQVNGAWIARAAGSTLKPFVYAMALEQGATAASLLPDVPVEFPTTTGLFTPVNYNRKCYGPVTIRSALANSLNIPAVRVLNQVGGPAALRQRLRECGLTTLVHDPDYYGLGMVIGNAEVRLLELVNAYACLARMGEYLPFRLFMEVATSKENVPQRIFQSDVAWLIADILSDNRARSSTFGLESSLNFDFPVACKTGTSTGFRDNWAIGYVPEFTVGVWVGNFDGSPMEGVSGVTGAAPILHELIMLLRTRQSLSWYHQPANILIRNIHSYTGKILASSSKTGLVEKFIPSALSPIESPDDYDQNGRVWLGNEYRSWYETATDSWIQKRWAIQSFSGQKLTIVSPAPGMIFYLDPDLPQEHQRLFLQAEGDDKIQWHSESLKCATQQGRAFVYLSVGRHEIMASNPHTGASASTWIWVKEP